MWIQQTLYYIIASDDKQAAVRTNITLSYVGYYYNYSYINLCYECTTEATICILF